jgi:hypothetical protein
MTIDPNMTVNQPLRTLYLVRSQAQFVQREMPKLRSSIEGHYYPHLPEALRDALDSIDVYLEGIVTMCDRYEPFRIEPEEGT